MTRHRATAGRRPDIGTVASWRGFLLAALLLTPAVARAQSGTCIALERRLAAISPAGASDEYAQYDEAVRQQRSELDRARRLARRAGCEDDFFIDTPGGLQCDDLAATMARMEANLEDLIYQRDRLGGSGTAAGQVQEGRGPVFHAELPRNKALERQRIEEALDAHGCDPGGALPATPPSVRASLLPGGGADTPDVGPNAVGSQEAPQTGGSGMISIEPDIPYGRYRTLCVRTCDGYYFPMSFGATPDQFARDQNACQARCPGADAELYFTRPDQEPETMMSLTGKPYTALPNAFKYRKAGLTAACSCRAQPPSNADINVLGNGSTPAPAASGQGGSTIAVPAQGAPDVMEHKAPASPATAAPNDTDTGEAVVPPGKRKIRVVGPRFLPDPSTAIDLKDPDRSDAR